MTSQSNQSQSQALEMAARFYCTVDTPSTVQPFYRYAEDGSGRVIHRRYSLVAVGKLYLGSAALAALDLVEKGEKSGFVFTPGADYMEVKLELMAFLPPENVQVDETWKIDLFEAFPTFKQGDRLVARGFLYLNEYLGLSERQQVDGRKPRPYVRRTLIFRPVAAVLVQKRASVEV